MCSLLQDINCPVGKACPLDALQIGGTLVAAGFLNLDTQIDPIRL